MPLQPTTTANNNDFDMISELSNSSLTPTQFKEAINQAHLSKDAIEKIEGLESSASEIDNAVAERITQSDLDQLVLASGNLTANQIAGAEKAYDRSAELDKLEGLTSSAAQINSAVSRFVNPLSFGVSYGVGLSEADRLLNYSNFKDACLYADSNGLTLNLSDSIEIEVSANSSIDLTNLLRIRGLSKEDTTIYVYPENTTLFFSFFKQLQGSSLYIDDLTIHKMGTSVNDTLTAKGGADTISFDGRDTSLYIVNTQITGEWFRNIYSDSINSQEQSTPSTVTIKDSFLHAETQIITIYSKVANAKALRIYNTELYDSGCLTDDLSGVHGHTIYIHPNTPIYCDNVFFNGYERLGVHHYGTAVVGDLECDYAIFENCRFYTDKSSSTGAMETSAYANTKVSNSYIEGRYGIGFRGNVSVIKTTFNMLNMIDGIFPSTSGVEEGSKIIVDDCDFINTCSILGASYGRAIAVDGRSNTVDGRLFSGEKLTFIIKNNRFDTALDVMSNSSIIKDTKIVTDSSLTLKDNIFRNLATTGTIESAIIFNNIPIVIAKDNIIDGLIVSMNKGLISTVFDNNEMLSTSSFSLNGSTVGGKYNGLIKFGTGINYSWTDVEMGFSIPKGKQSIVSSSDLNIPLDGNVIEISGTATINNVYLGENNQFPNHITNMFIGEIITIISSDGVTISSSGNVQEEIILAIGDTARLQSIGNNQWVKV